MENIQLKDGQNVIIGSNRDITEAIEENMGYEFAEAMHRFIGGQIYEYQQIAEAETYEKNAIEGSLESFQNLMRDVLEELEEVTNYIEEAKRINKDQIYQKLMRMKKSINADDYCKLRSWK